MFQEDFERRAGARRLLGAGRSASRSMPVGTQSHPVALPHSQLHRACRTRNGRAPSGRRTGKCLRHLDDCSDAAVGDVARWALQFAWHADQCVALRSPPRRLNVQPTAHHRPTPLPPLQRRAARSAWMGVTTCSARGACLTVAVFKGSRAGH